MSCQHLELKGRELTTIANLLALSFGKTLGQMFATMCVPVDALLNFLASSTVTIFSCQRRLAHFLRSASGENFLATTHTNRTCLRSFLEAKRTLRKLNGLP